jgi:hypothetical protein
MLGVLGHRGVDEARKPHARLDGVVVHELELRHRVQVEPVRKLAAQEAPRARQRIDGLACMLLAREVGEEHPGVRQVGRDLDLGDRHPAHARILDLVGEQIGEFALDLVAHALRALGVLLHGSIIPSRPRVGAVRRSSLHRAGPAGSHVARLRTDVSLTRGDIAPRLRRAALASRCRECLQLQPTKTFQRSGRTM